jgi:hypothetical protein
LPGGLIGGQKAWAGLFDLPKSDVWAAAPVVVSLNPNFCQILKVAVASVGLPFAKAGTGHLT